MVLALLIALILPLFLAFDSIAHDGHSENAATFGVETQVGHGHQASCDSSADDEAVPSRSRPRPAHDLQPGDGDTAPDCTSPHGLDRSLATSIDWEPHPTRRDGRTLLLLLTVLRN